MWHTNLNHWLSDVATGPRQPTLPTATTTPTTATPFLKLFGKSSCVPLWLFNENCLATMNHDSTEVNKELNPNHLLLKSPHHSDQELITIAIILQPRSLRLRHKRFCPAVWIGANRVRFTRKGGSSLEESPVTIRHNNCHLFGHILKQRNTENNL